MKTIFKYGLFILFFSLLIACNNETKTTTDSLEVNEEVNEEIIEDNIQEANPLAYHDEEFGLTITFPENWENHFEVLKFMQDYFYYDENIPETIITIPFIYDGVNYYEREYGLGHLFEIVVIHEPIDKQDWTEHPIIHWDYINCNNKYTYSFRFPHQLAPNIMDNETIHNFYMQLSGQIEEIIENMDIVNASEDGRCSNQQDFDLTKQIYHFIENFNIDEERLGEPMILGNEIALYNNVFPTDQEPNNITHLAIYNREGDLLHHHQQESRMYVDYINNPKYKYVFALSTVGASGIGYADLIALDETNKFVKIGEIEGYTGTKLNNHTQMHEIMANDYNHSPNVPMAGRTPIPITYYWDEDLSQYVIKE